MKNKMVRILILISMTLCLLNSCGSKATSTTEEIQTTTAVESTEAVIEESLNETTKESSLDTSEDTSAAQEEVNASADEVTVESQTISMESIGNARELGGYETEDGRRVKRGILLRTAALSKASEEDIKRLVDEYRLNTVVDFRMTMENAAAPDPEIPGVENVNIHILDEGKLKNADSKQDLLKNVDMNDPIAKINLAIEMGMISDHMYIDFLSSDAGKAGYTEFFEKLKNLPEGKSLLFHCTQGKD